jgi:Na+/H+ antiporter NhaD/arsenite permease-like protein
LSLTIAVLFLSTLSFAAGVTREVKHAPGAGQYATITAALADSANGDTIEIVDNSAPFAEAVFFDGKTDITIQGAATLVGDTTSILLGGYAGLDFLDFFAYRGRPGMFWVVEVSAVIATLVLLFVFRKDNEEIHLKDRTPVTDMFPTVMLLGTIMLLILASFLPEKPAITNGLICMSLFVICMIRSLIKYKGFKEIKESLKSVDYFTLGLLAGLFIVIAGITKAGVVDAIAALFVKLSGNNLFLMYSLIVWASVILSAFIDNIPYIATMLPVVAGIAALLKVDPTLLYFGLLSGATLGGNLTPIGASANIAGLGILRKEGYEVSVGQFMKISVPFTLAAVVTGYILVWVIWCR